MKWIDKTDEAQTILEEEMLNVRKIETTYEGTPLKAIHLQDKRNNNIVRLVSGEYGSSMKVYIPKSDEEKKEA